MCVRACVRAKAALANVRGTTCNQSGRSRNVWRRRIVNWFVRPHSEWTDVSAR